MSEIKETILMYKQLIKEHKKLMKGKGHFFEIKELELHILQTEAQLRNLGVDF